MSHKNYHRPIGFRKPVPTKPNKVIIPDSIYDRQKDKKRIDRLIKEYVNG